MNPFDPFDILDQLHDVEITPELEEAERELQQDSDHGAQMLAICIVLALIALAIWAGWRAW